MEHNETQGLSEAHTMLRLDVLRDPDMEQSWRWVALSLTGQLFCIEEYKRP